MSRDIFVGFGNVGQRAWSPQFALAGLWLGSFLIRLVCASLSRVQRRFCYWLGKTCTTHEVGFLWQNLLYTRDRDAQTRFSKKNKNGGLDFFEKPCLGLGADQATRFPPSHSIPHRPTPSPHSIPPRPPRPSPAPQDNAKKSQDNHK